MLRFKSLKRRIFDINPLAHCERLSSLSLKGLSSLTNVDPLVTCLNLWKLDLEGCDSLTNVDGLINCRELRYLDLGNCISLLDANGLVNAWALHTLRLMNCPAHIREAYQWKGDNDFVLPKKKITSFSALYHWFRDTAAHDWLHHSDFAHWLSDYCRGLHLACGRLVGRRLGKYLPSALVMTVIAMALWWILLR